MSYFLTPLNQQELREIFDDISIDVINYFLKKSVLAQPELIPDQSQLPIHIPKEHIEQWVVQAIGATSIGAGSYPIDLYKEDLGLGADVKMMSCKVSKDGTLLNADSGETSLAQKFDDSNFGEGVTLDQLFSSRSYETIWNAWKIIVNNKYNSVIKQHNLTNLYYFFMLRANDKFYLGGTKLNLNNIDQVTIDMPRSSNSSLWLNNLINPSFGNTKIYKSKKRLELRLRPKKWLEDKLLIKFKNDIIVPQKNIRELIEENKLQEYIEDELICQLVSQKEVEASDN